MKREKVLEVKVELDRFTKKLEALLQKFEDEKHGYLWGCSESAAVKRSSMDLSMALAEMRKSK